MMCNVMGHTWVTEDGIGDVVIKVNVNLRCYEVTFITSHSSIIEGEMIYFQGKQLCRDWFSPF